MRKLPYHVRAVRAAADVHDHGGALVPERLYDAGGHRGRVEILGLEVEHHALPLQLRLTVARAEQRLRLVHIEKMHPASPLPRHAQGEIDRRLRLAGAGFAYEHQVFLFWKLELCHTKPPFSKVFRRFRGSCVFIINAFVTKHQTKSLRIKVLNPALYSKIPGRAGDFCDICFVDLTYPRPGRRFYSS